MTKSNLLVDASYALSAQAQKLVLACLSKIDSRKKATKEMTLTASEFSNLMGIDLSNAHRELYKAADSLFKSTIKIKTELEEIEIYWIQKKAKKLRGQGKITLVWSDDVIKYISSLKNHFTTYKLRQIANLQSSHSIRIYELLMRYNNTTKERLICVDDFRSALGVEEKYLEFKALNRNVIKPAINELNKKSDIYVTYETIKKGRSVAAIFFEFGKNKQK
ncbi:replication initiation protein [uncultured Shewanella sp.]|uniref:replication initiation protein n=1 Tax=uncultured Shewanella sp. TaxID=173975 RepID=UPI0026150BBD|nr:replication initiation protein [uncultured Shewanella sp.]